MKKIILLFSILLVGCYKVPEPCVNETITINNTIIINRTITEPCNTTLNLICPECEYDREYVLSLIRRLEYFEKEQKKYFNDTECRDIDKLKMEFEDCEYDLNESKVELIECRDNLCDYNSSFC